MRSDAHRKLLVAAGAVAAFFGFVALTGWTSSGEMDAQERRNMGTFCSALALGDDYEGMITTAAVAGGEGVFGGGGVVDNGLSSFIEGTLLDFAPEQYREDAGRVVDGLERAMRGELTMGEAEEYAMEFHSLEARASGDCEEFEGETPDFGGSPFGVTDED